MVREAVATVCARAAGNPLALQGAVTGVSVTELVCRYLAGIFVTFAIVDTAVYVFGCFIQKEWHYP